MTPTTSLALPDRIERATGRAAGGITFVTGGKPDQSSWAELHSDARAMAAALQSEGVMPGDHVALLGVTSRSFVTALQATWLAGACAVVLPLPFRMTDIAEFISQTRQRIQSADAKLVLIARDFAAFIERHHLDPPFAVLETFVQDAGNPTSEAFNAPKISLDSLAILQFTSGSTSDPKGVMLPHAQVGANLDAISIAAQVDVDNDVCVSWLPLYHDMGLIGMLTLPMTTGMNLVLGAPSDFMSNPSSWVQWMSDYRGTATAGPNFSYALAARAMRRMSGLDLSRWRIALNGAEPVDPATVAAFVEAGAPHGLDPRAVFPAFGMAETCIAGTFPAPFSGLQVDTIDRARMEDDGYAAPCGADADKSRVLPILGRPVPGLEIRITDPATGDVLAERMSGELEIRGTSVTTGYYKRPDETADKFHDGWLRTGDLAYMLDGQLVLCGRLKDLVIIGGRNILPQDVERAAVVNGVRPGNVIAFGVESRKGREALVVVAEVKGTEHDIIRDEIRHAVYSAVGESPEDVLLVEPGTLPKTSSGKLQRSLCRSRYLEHALAPA